MRNPEFQNVDFIQTSINHQADAIEKMQKDKNNELSEAERQRLRNACTVMKSAVDELNFIQR